MIILPISNLYILVPQGLSQIAFFATCSLTAGIERDKTEKLTIVDYHKLSIGQ